MDDFISGRRTFFAIALTTQENLKNICLLIPLTETKELQYTCPQIRDWVKHLTNRYICMELLFKNHHKIVWKTCSAILANNHFQFRAAWKCLKVSILCTIFSRLAYCYSHLPVLKLVCRPVSSLVYTFLLPVEKLILWFYCTTKGVKK